MCEKSYHQPDWAVGQVIRYDRNGMVEDICIHGVGHPNQEWLRRNPDSSSVHGCDGCCYKKPQGI